MPTLPVNPAGVIPFISMALSDSASVQVEGETLHLTHLNKKLYSTGFTKAELLDYYRQVAPFMLPHLKGRIVTLIRYPEGTDQEGFFAKNAPSYTPDWIRTEDIPSPGSSKERKVVHYLLIEDLKSLIWVANLAGVEIHIPQWKVGPRGKLHPPDLLVFELDPGPPAGLLECAAVAHLLRKELEADHLQVYPKTSGKKGLHLYVPIKESSGNQTSAYARALAEKLTAQHPDLITYRMDKQLRGGKVLIDWSQNNPRKTTVAPYSLRARKFPTVATPVKWEELESPPSPLRGRVGEGVKDSSSPSPDQLVFTPQQVLDRVAKYGDLLKPLLDKRGRGNL